MTSKLGKLVLLFTVLIFALPTHAQQTLGAITGTVTDPTGAAVPDAAVSATNLATNLEVAAQTKQNGSYQIPQLPAGMEIGGVMAEHVTGDLGLFLKQSNLGCG